MKKTGIFFGSTNGTTESIAEQIAKKLNIDSADVHNVSQASPEDFGKYEVLLLGSSTWGSGDLQDDWYDFLPKIKTLDLSDKLVSLFGCGDSVSFGDTFCDALGTIFNNLKETHCKFIGFMDTEDYSFEYSTAIADGKFVGLPLDEMNEDDRTTERIDKWIATLKKEGIE